MSYDLTFRPEYASPLDALSAILSNVKGQRRRELIRDVASGHARAAVVRHGGDPRLADLLSEVDETLLADAMEDPGRLGAIGPTWLGGEFLPGYLRGEVEIARIVMATTTMDVVSIRARRRTNGYRYRVVDEYKAPFRFAPRTSKAPLTLGEALSLVLSLDFEDSSPGPTGAVGVIFGNLDWQLGNGDPEEEVRGFIEVESDFYPGLGALVEEEISQWLRRRLAPPGDPAP